jgi:hypothetical protein
MTNHDSTPDPKLLPISPKPSLFDFIELNHKLITVLGVFTALTAFSTNLPIKGFAQAISALFLTLTLIVWIELWGRFPSSTGTTILIWFESILGLTMLALIGYWVVSVRTVFPPLVFILVFGIIINIISWVMKKFDLYNRILHTQPGGRKLLRYVLGTAIIVLSFAITFFITAMVSLPIDKFLSDYLGIKPFFGK